MKTNHVPDTNEAKNLLHLLKSRFDQNGDRHPGVQWEEVDQLIGSNPEAMKTLWAMEETGGEPDVVVFEDRPMELYFVDCAQETPQGRRNVCYDEASLESRKKNKPGNSAKGMAQDMGIQLLTEEQYRSLQEVFPFDKKTSSWIETPEKIRNLGGALFCDRRYDTVFVYHNGADSYYSARGFRGFFQLS